MDPDRRQGLSLLPLILLALAVALALGTTAVLVVSTGGGRRFAERDVGLTRRAGEGVVFVVCPHRTIHKIVVRGGTSPDSPVQWTTSHESGSGRAEIVANERTPGYDTDGMISAQSTASLAVADYLVDSGVSAAPAYIEFEPRSLTPGRILTGGGESVGVDAWQEECEAQSNP